MARTQRLGRKRHNERPVDVVKNLPRPTPQLRRLADCNTAGFTTLIGVPAT